MVNHETETTSRLIARIVREVLKADGPFDTVADLADVLKRRLTHLRIAWTPDDISAAFAMIESNTWLTASRGTPRRP